MEHSTSPVADSNGRKAHLSKSRWNGRFSITVTLATAISLLVLVSVGTVLGVGIWLAQKNTLTLLSNSATQNVAVIVQRIIQHLKPAEYQAQFIATRISSGDIDPNDRKIIGLTLTGALAATPQVDAVMFIRPNLQTDFAGRTGPSGKVSFRTIDYSDDPIVRKRTREAYLAARQSRDLGARWIAPVWREQPKKTYMIVGYPVWRDDEWIGSVVAIVSVRELSEFLSKTTSADSGRRFILYGRSHVLAHPLMAQGYPDRTIAKPLPALAGFRDPVLAAIWQEENRSPVILNLAADTRGHVIDLEGGEYVYLYRRIDEFGTEPWYAGAYFRVADVSTAIQRMMISLVAGICALLLSLVAAVVLGRRIGRPIVEFSAAAAHIRDLEVTEVKELPGSIFRELNDQSKAFNAMLRALRWFQLYVPKKIVESLVKRGELRDTTSSARNLTVLFTDIAGFSTLSENMSASEVTAFVNRHFELVAGCIEAEDGTVDKFMGDSVMAFWGAPEPQEETAVRACRAALAIAEAVRAENEKRHAAGQPPVGIRIGVHTGTATVGNIGAPSRINYTIIGDSVNVGQRLEQLGKEICPAGTDVCILISGDTAAALGSGFTLVPVGPHKLKGRAGEVDIFKLEPARPG